MGRDPKREQGCDPGREEGSSGCARYLAGHRGGHTGEPCTVAVGRLCGSGPGGSQTASVCAVCGAESRGCGRGIDSVYHRGEIPGWRRHGGD